jgi:hypothetical protein
VLLGCAQTFRNMKEVVGLCDAGNVALMATLRGLWLEERGDEAGGGGRKGFLDCCCCGMS